MQKLVVLIPDGENEHVLWTVRSLVQSGQVRVHVLSDRRWTQIRFSRHCRTYRFKPTGTDFKARVEALTEMAGQVHCDVILPVGEEGVLFAAMERQSLSRLAALPPLPSLESLGIARNKWRLNQFARQHRLPVPDSVFVTFDREFQDRAAALEYPVLLKPTSMTDGLGIRRFDSFDDLWGFLQGQEKSQFKDRYLVQSFVHGVDQVMSVLCRDGEMLAYTMQRGVITAAERFGPQMAMEFIRHEDVLETGRKLLAALGWSGVACIDFRRDERDGQAKILEINARYWGSLLGSLVAGVNFPYLACLAAQGETFPLPTYRLSKYAYTTTVLKEGVRRLVGKSSLKGLSFHETGLRFFLADPLPEISKRLLLPILDGRSLADS